MSQAESLELIQAQPFGLLTTSEKDRITQAFLPFIFDQKEHCLFGHLAKQNEQIDAIADSQNSSVTFQGEHAYISPSWYESSQQVPTWNYQAVKVRGVAHLLNHQETLKVITDLSNHHEQQFDEPWTMGKLSQKKIDAMLRAIVGIRIDILEIVGINKMSQNKTEPDQMTVVTGLKNQPDNSSRKVAEIIDKGRG